MSVPSPCFCGHDCARCVTYLATLRKDEKLRRQSQHFYLETFGREIPLAKLSCCGGRSDNRFFLAHDCPFRSCAERRGLDRCTDCPDYPCPPLDDYTAKYVNRCNQLPE